MASLRDALTSMETTVDGLIGKLTSASSTMAGKGGRINTGNNFLNNALGSFSSNPSVAAASQFNMGMGVVRGAGQMVQGATQMMPDISATMDRMTTYYNATLRASSGMSRNQVQQMTMGAMQGGMTAPGSDAMVGGYLSMRGMIADASFGSTYQETVRGVSGAAKYLNMSNERAVAAIEGMTSGQGSSNMLRQFGILTADPRTGKEKTQGQIFNELYGRLTSGRGTATREETMDSFRRGALGATLRNSGLSEDQQQMFVAYAMEKSEGRELDLSDPQSVSAAMEAAGLDSNKNPNLPGYALNTSKTNAMQNAQEAYLAGIQAVTPVLQGLTEAGGILAAAFGGLTAAVAMLSGSMVAGGAAAMLGGAGKAALGVGMLGMASKAGGKGGLTAKAFGGAKGGLLKAGGAVGAVAGLAGTAASVGGSYETAKSGGDAFGNVLGAAGSGALTGASIGMFLGPKGALVGAAIGGIVGGIAGTVGAMSGAGAAEGGDQGTSNTNGSGAPQQFKLMHPTKSAQITAVFGQRESSFTKGKITWPNGHKGIDYAGKEGDTIFASEGGYATLHDGGQLGKRVRIKHANGMYTHYCHLSGITVREGQVNKGQPIGRMGSTGGKSTGVHLHFALSTGPDTSSAIDPQPYLTGGGNYLSSAPADSEQAPSSTSPTSAGTTSAATNPGGEDSSPSSPTSATNRSEGTATNVPTAPGGQGSSAANGVESWSAGSIWSSGGGANTAAAPEGGENSSDQPGYLSPASSGSVAASRGKNGRETRVVTNNVSINLSIEKGTPEEARRFAQMLQKALEDDNAMKAMARN